ncbi:MAG TPA: hypothetical protein VMB50_22490, partial [Myxococcales bacterium]|nr:hypothetical protein [Myxococcales bacterium]
TNDGTCVPEVVQGVTVGLCYQAGPTPSSCDPAATRADLGNACVTGDYCFTSPGGGFPGGGCVPICLPGTACSVAGAAGNCVTALASDPELGVCQLNPSTTGGTGTGGTTGGVTSGGSGGTGGTTGCPSSAVPAEFSPCHTQDDCGCPFICTSDVRAGGQVCEYPCQQTSDCPDLVTVCGNQGACNVDGCGPGTGNGTFNGLCSVPGVGKQDGTCLPLTDDGGISLGYCYQAGTSPETGCDPSGTRGDLSRVCPAGQMCFGGAITFGGTCNQICDPQVGGPCPGGQYCSYIVNEPLLGICIDQNGF